MPDAKNGEDEGNSIDWAGVGEGLNRQGMRDDSELMRLRRRKEGRK